MNPGATAVCARCRRPIQLKGSHPVHGPIPTRWRPVSPGAAMNCPAPSAGSMFCTPAPAPEPGGMAA